MSSIVTFYSYKGGVGRSMALANIAVLLARRGLRVLAVDWDLEAPGLDRYFSCLQMEMRGLGLLRMFIDAENGRQPDYKDFVCEVHADTEHPIAFLPSGREQDMEYAKNLERFDWNDFFEKKDGGNFIEELRTRWHKDFDVVLIDSRTGLSDTGGICTIQLPDVVVAMFTANHQSLYGVRDVMRLTQLARQTLAYERMPLTIFPLPSRFSARAEFREAQDWLLRFEEALKEFYSDWLPKDIRPKQVLERIKIPQIEYFSFGEKLAVVEHGTNDPEGMGYVYDKVSAFLASNFSDLEVLVGHEALQGRDDRLSQNDQIKLKGVTRGEVDEYQYDLFVSYHRTASTFEWLRHFVEVLNLKFERSSGYPLKVFLDTQELPEGEIVFEHTQQALRRSKLLLSVTTPAYFRSKYALAELLTFKRRTEITGKNLIVPLILRSVESFPEWFKKYEGIDFQEGLISGGGNFRKTSKHPKFEERISQVTQSVAELLAEAPVFDHNWPVVSFKETQTLLLSGKHSVSASKVARRKA